MCDWICFFFIIYLELQDREKFTINKFNNIWSNDNRKNILITDEDIWSILY